MSRSISKSGLCIISSPGAPHADALASALEDRGYEPLRVILGDSLEPRPLPPLRFRVAYVDAVPHAVPRAFAADGAYWLYHDWYSDWMDSLARKAIVDAWFHEHEARGATLVSSPLSVLAHNKLAQLDALRRAGLPVPAYIATQDPALAETFVRSVKDAVMKPVLGGGFAVAVDASTDLALLKRSPALLQARVRGADVRVTAVRGSVLSAVVIRQDGADPALLDYRAHAGAPRYEPFEPSVALAKLCDTALDACGMHFGGLDFKRDARGRLHLLECNAQPGWLAIAMATGAPITAGLAAYLMKLAGVKAKTAKPGTTTATRAREARASRYSL